MVEVDRRALTEMRGTEVARHTGRITLLPALEEVASSCLHCQLEKQYYEQIDSMVIMLTWVFCSCDSPLISFEAT